MKFKSSLLFSLVSTFICLTTASANHTEGTTEALGERPLVVTKFSAGKKARADLWPMKHGVLTGLPKDMIPAHRSAPKNPPAIPAQ